MELSNPWVQLGLQVVIGTIAGGITNAVAVWMLFHPRDRRLGLHGAIPKNKARLARSIGRTVGERLLTPADVLAEISRAGLREAFDERLTAIIARLLETERGPLRELLPAAVLAEVEAALDAAGPVVADRFATYVETPEFEARVREFVARTRAEIADRPLGSVLTADRRTRLTARAAAWAEDVALSPELERGLREYLAQRAADFFGSPAPLLERVPPAVVAALETAIDAYLPLAVEKLGAFLHHPAARERIREALHGLFHRFVEDLRFHERVIARLVVTERTFDKAIDALERDGVEQLAALLDDPVVRTEISRTIHDAVLTYLRKPVTELVGDPTSERAQGLVRLAGDYLLRAVRAERTRNFLVAKLEDVLTAAEGRTWGELLAPLDDATIAGWIVDAARAPRARALVQDGVQVAVRRALERPIGRPGRWLPDDAAARLAGAIVPALWTWLETQVPAVIARLNIEQMVERKVNAFSTDRLEEILRAVIQRELDLIVRLGYVLGAMIGLLMFGLARLFPG